MSCMNQRLAALDHMVDQFSDLALEANERRYHRLDVVWDIVQVRTVLEGFPALAPFNKAILVF